MIKEYVFDTKEELIRVLNEEEIKYISIYNSVIPNGYNIQRGGKSPTDSMKRPVDKYSLDGILLKSYNSILDACSDSKTKINRVHIAECCDGTLHTSAGFVWRDKGDAFDKYKTSDKRITPISQYTKDGILINHYDSMKEAISKAFNSKDFKNYSSHITSCCKGKRHTAYGFIWKYHIDSLAED